MRSIGIVAEYNPFHNGHKYQTDYARQVLGFDNVVVAMSGPFTQRGTIAITEKYSRAQMALMNGADMVVEIPVLFATASAKEYAAAGVQLLYKSGCTDILFGTEGADEKAICQIAGSILDAENNPEFDALIRKYISSGLSYATSRSNALKEFINAYDENLASSPNNILAIEYTRYIIKNNLKIEIHTLNRTDKGYHSTNSDNEFASATQIRSILQSEMSGCICGVHHISDELLEKTRLYIPKSCTEILLSAPLLNEDSVSLLLHEKLFESDSFSEYLDCSEDLSNRILNHRAEYTSLSAFIELLKSKDLSYTRISRVLCHILLGITKDLFDDAKKHEYITYIHVLGCTQKGLSLLSDLKQSDLPVITNIKDIEFNDSLSQRVFSIDEKAYNISRMLASFVSSTAVPLEISRKFLKI